MYVRCTVRSFIRESQWIMRFSGLDVPWFWVVLLSDLNSEHLIGSGSFSIYAYDILYIHYGIFPRMNVRLTKKWITCNLQQYVVFARLNVVPFLVFPQTILNENFQIRGFDEETCLTNRKNLKRSISIGNGKREDGPQFSSEFTVSMLLRIFC